MAQERNGKPERRTLLEISTLAPQRPVVTIDDVEHEFRLRQEFGATEDQEFARDSQAYDALWSQAKLKRVEQERMERLLDSLFATVLVNPSALREQLGEKLTGNMKREIVLTFTNAPSLMAALEAIETSRESSSTTES